MTIVAASPTQRAAEAAIVAAAKKALSEDWLRWELPMVLERERRRLGLTDTELRAILETV